MEQDKTRKGDGKVFHILLKRLSIVFDAMRPRSRWIVACLLGLNLMIICGISPRIVMRTRITSLGAWGGFSVSHNCQILVFDSVNYGLFEDIYYPAVTQMGWFRIDWWRHTERRMRWR